MDSTVISPPVPFVGNVPNGLYPGRVIVIQGFVSHGAHRFTVDLGFADNIAMHVNPRFEEGCIVRNHYNNGSWGSEERHPNSLGSLAKGQTFELMILTEATHFKIAIGGRHYTEFAHRMPYQSVKILQIRGDIQLHRVEFRVNYNAPAYPVQTGYPVAVCPSGPPAPTSATNKNMPLYNPALPLRHRILGGLEYGNVISLSGRPTNTPHRFVINLVCGGGPVYEEEIALHFNIRFDQFAVVRNSLIGGQWGTEERGGGFPFQAAVNFDLILRVFPGCFEITMNGQYFGTYSHRVMPVNRISFLHVDGDVIVSSVRFL